MYYLCSENKGTDQLRGDRAADLHICFHIMQKAGFLGLRPQHRHPDVVVASLNDKVR